MQVSQRSLHRQVLLALMIFSSLCLIRSDDSRKDVELTGGGVGDEPGWIDPVSMRQSASPGRLAAVGNHSLTLTAEPYQCVGTWFTTVADATYQVKLDSASLDPACDQAWHWAVLSDESAILREEGGEVGQQCQVDQLSEIPPPVIGLCPRSRLHGSVFPYHDTSEDVEEEGPGVAGFVFDAPRLRSDASNGSSCGMGLVPGAANVDVVIYLSNRCSNTASVQVSIIVGSTWTTLTQEEGTTTKDSGDGYGEDAATDPDAKKLVMYFIVTLISAPAVACVCGACVAAACYSMRKRGRDPIPRRSLEMNTHSQSTVWRGDAEGFERESECGRQVYNIPMMVAVVEIQDMRATVAEEDEGDNGERSHGRQASELPLSCSAPAVISERDRDMDADEGGEEKV